MMEVWEGKFASPILLALIFSFSTLIVLSSAQQSRPIGINYGRQGNNLLSPFLSIEIMKSMQAGLVKLYDADPETLKLLAGTGIRACITVPNEEITNIASNQTIASQWVRDNVLAYYPRTMIRYIMVGNKVYKDNDRNQWSNLVQAMQHIKNSLNSHNIHNVKISSPMAMDVLSSSSPPSNGTFLVTSLSTMVPFLEFLNKTKSFFFVDVYPYYTWSSHPERISLNYTLFEGNSTYTDPISGLNYTNLFDQMLDAIHFAMEKVGFPNISIAISETGWPNAGDLDQPGANIYNAATYNRNIVKKMVADPPIGTPARPGSVMPTFLSSLYNENLRNGSGVERNWGLVNPDGSAIYEIDLSGAKEEYGPLPRPNNNGTYRGEVWCVVSRFANMSGLGVAFREACKGLNRTCEDELGPGKDCYEPVSLTWHASYAFNAYYWAMYKNNSSAPCYFNGFASLTTIDPSHGSCKFPSVTV